MVAIWYLFYHPLQLFSLSDVRLQVSKVFFRNPCPSPASVLGTLSPCFKPLFSISLITLLVFCYCCCWGFCIFADRISLLFLNSVFNKLVLFTLSTLSLGTNAQSYHFSILIWSLNLNLLTASALLGYHLHFNV